jgi:hypothetical protein
LAAAQAINIAQDLPKPVESETRAAIAASAAGVASNQYLGQERPRVFEAVAAQAAADEVVPKYPADSDFDAKEKRREVAAFVGTSAVVASVTPKRQLCSRFF